MKSILALLAFSLSFAGFSQTLFEPFFDSAARKNELNVFANVDVNSTSIKREFFNTLIWGGTIDSDMKDRTFKSHKGVNRFGIYANAEIEYKNGDKGKPDKKFGWNVKAGYYAIGNITYTKDLFELMFYGNENIKNDTAYLSGTKVKFTQFSKLGFGFYSLKNGSGLTFNLVNVENDFSGGLRTGKWIDHNYSTEIEFQMNGDFYMTNQRPSNGLGVALDGQWNFNVPWGKSKAIFQLSAQNIGAAYMYAGQIHYSADTTFHYSGFTINQIINRTFDVSSTKELLDSLGVKSDTVKRWTLLPGYIQAAKIIDIQANKKLQSFLGIRLYPALGAVPMGYAGLYYRFINACSVSGYLAYGGSAKFRGGLSVAYHVKRLRLQVGVDDVYGLLSKRGYSSSFYGRLSWILRK